MAESDSWWIIRATDRGSSVTGPWPGFPAYYLAWCQVTESPWTQSLVLCRRHSVALEIMPRPLWLNLSHHPGLTYNHVPRTGLLSINLWMFSLREVSHMSRCSDFWSGILLTLRSVHIVLTPLYWIMSHGHVYHCMKIPYYGTWYLECAASDRTLYTARRCCIFFNFVHRRCWFFLNFVHRRCWFFF